MEAQTMDEGEGRVAEAGHGTPAPEDPKPSGGDVGVGCHCEAGRFRQSSNSKKGICQVWNEISRLCLVGCDVQVLICRL